MRSRFRCVQLRFGYRNIELSIYPKNIGFRWIGISNFRHIEILVFDESNMVFNTSKYRIVEVRHVGISVFDKTKIE